MSDRNTQHYFFEAVFRKLNEAGLRYVVLHSWQSLPDVATSDVDMLIDEGDKLRLEPLLKRVARETGWRYVNKLWYDVPWCFYFVFVSPKGEESVALDFISDPNGIGEYRIKNEQILSNREFDGFLWHLTTESELAYKLAKRLVKGVFKEEDFEFVRSYYAQSDKKVLKIRMSELMSESVVSWLMSLMGRDDVNREDFEGFMRSMSPAFKFFGRRWRISFNPKWWLLQVKRIVHRMKYPTGYVLYVSDEDAVAEFPKFVFRRKKILPVLELTKSREERALSSSTLLLVVNPEAKKSISNVEARDNVLEVMSRRWA